MSRLGPSGPGRTLAVVYAVFALAATARSITQIASQFGDAPLAYSLSLLAGAVYLVAALSVNRPDRLQLALACVCFELAGVVAVGTLSLADPGLFDDETVWSEFGSGYGYLPAFLPLLGLGWLRSRK